MRINRNINQYLDRMQPEDVSRLWRVLVDMEWEVKQTEFYYDGKIDVSDQYVLGVVETRMDTLRYRAKKTDKFMQALGLESLFGTEKMSFPLTDEDYRSILARYRYLMAEPEE